jgi:hypothetical protein
LLEKCLEVVAQLKLQADMLCDEHREKLDKQQKQVEE